MITAGLGNESAVAGVCDAVTGCGWVAGALSAGGGLTGLGVSTRPIDELGAAGLGALAPEVADLQDVVDRLAGDAAAVQAFADTWRRVGESVGQAGQRLGSTAGTGTATWRGESGTRYRDRAAEVAGALRETAALSSMIGTLAGTMGEVVAGARRRAGDELAALVRRLISYVRTASAAEGGITPHVLARASGLVEASRAPILRAEDEVRQSMSNVESLLDSGGTAVAPAGVRGARLAMNCGPLGQKPMPGEVHVPDPIAGGCAGGGGGGGGGGRGGTQTPPKPPATGLPAPPPSNPPPATPPRPGGRKPGVFDPPQQTLQRRNEKEFLERERELLKRDAEHRRTLEKLYKRDYERGVDYRAQCEAVHGPPPGDGRKYHAHHPFPVEWHREFRERFGIDTADPKWCSWVDDTTHGQIHKNGYNANWKNWIDNNPNATREDALDHARSLANGRYTLPWTNEPWAR
ncbi:WXG100 family type VII secretion target [Lentzea sp. NPDC060358]|uniref:WXG100 family type VII secretion target n=1 Tax=Lentzea sp. NPDC060358 TaxID=3347103 RepID=UPI003657CEFB